MTDLRSLCYCVGNLEKIPAKPKRVGRGDSALKLLRFRIIHAERIHGNGFHYLIF